MAKHRRACDGTAASRNDQYHFDRTCVSAQAVQYRQISCSSSIFSATRSHGRTKPGSTAAVFRHIRSPGLSCSPWSARDGSAQVHRRPVTYADEWRSSLNVLKAANYGSAARHGIGGCARPASRPAAPPLSTTQSCHACEKSRHRHSTGRDDAAGTQH